MISEMNQIDEEYINRKAFLETQEKQMRWNQSSDSREVMIQNELSPLLKDAAIKKELIESMENQQDQTKQDLLVYENLLTEKRAKKGELIERQEMIHSQLQQLRNSLEDIVSERKKLWRDNETINTDIEKITAIIDKENGDFNRMVVFDGIVDI